MALPTYQEQLQGGMVSFDAPTIRARGPDMSPLRQAVQNWSVDLQRQEEEKAVEMQQRLANVQQTEMGVSQIARAPDVAERFQQVFQEQALATHSELLKTDATRTLAELSRRHQYDPNGLAASWSTYVKGQVDELNRTDRGYAANVRRALEPYADSAVERARAAAQARAKEAAKVQATLARAEMQRSMQDMLFQDPTEENFLEQTQRYQESLELDYQAGLMTASEYVNETLRYADELQIERVYGRIERLEQDGDLAGAYALIEDLEQGKLFAENATGRQLANSLRSRFKTNTDSMLKTEIFQTEQMLDSLLYSVQSGGVVDQETYTMAAMQFSAVAPSMTDKQRADGMNALNAVGRYQTLRTELPNASLPEMNQLTAEFQSPEAFLAYGKDSANTMRDIVGTRAQELTTAISARDLAVFGPNHALSYDAVVSLPPEMRQRGRVQAAENSGRPIEQVPPFTREQSRQALEAMDSAMQTGDFARALGLWNSYMAEFDTRADAAISIANSGQNDAFAARALIAAFLPPVDAQEFMAGAYQGAQLPRLEQKLPSNISERLDVFRSVYPSLGAQFEDVIQSYMAAQKVFNPSLNDSDIKKRTIDVLDNVEVAETPRGVRFPALFLGEGPAERDLNNRRMELYFDQNKSDVRLDYATFIRVNGGVELRSNFDGFLIERIDDQDPEIVQSRLTDEEHRAKQQTDQLQRSTFFGANVPRMISASAEESGVPVEAANALQRSLAFTPPRELGKLINNVPLEADKYIIPSRAYASFDPRAEAGGKYFKELLDRYGSVDKALAAYYVGSIEDADKMFELGGEGWLEIVDTPIKNFVRKGLEQ